MGVAVRARGFGGDAGAAAKQARRDHPRVIHHQQLVAAEYLRKVAEKAVFPALPAASDQQQARGVPLLERLLRDEFPREHVVQVRQFH